MDPLDLPIYRYESEIIRAITDHRVLVLEGPTGSGKTTQLPKILKRALVTDKVIGVTQPRRIAAVSVSWRIAAELNVALGTDVGYAIRFDDQTSARTTLKVMTDGILLQEARTDPDFSRYGVIIVDEAHERTLNIDVILGLLHRALTRRPDLRVIVSSATLQPLLFQRYFESAVGHVPVISIDARPYPVDVVYRPARSDDDASIVEAVTAEVSEICRSGEEGHILVFLSGEGMIRQTIDALGLARLPRDVELLPLYGKLTRAEQERVFDDLPGRRKVVLATNIAETSITVAGVRFVVDSGVAKVPRFQPRTGIMTLFQEGISKASADQRAGRAGRTAPGRCVRLYSPKSYAQRPDFTDEEITRLDLAEVVLRLIDLGVPEVEDFPLPTPPAPKAVKTAVAMLVRMGAIDAERRLTRIGQRMMPFPLTPPLARMVVEAADRFPAAVDDALIVAAFMSAHSPFLYPEGEEAQARAAQRALQQPSGDALTVLYTFERYLAAESADRFCRQYYLERDVMAFIRKAYTQLRDIAEHIGIAIGHGGDRTQVLRCLAAGFSHQILRQNGRVYEGMGDTPISIHPSSALFGERAPFIVAADIVISTRPYARNASALKPEWIVEVNPELAREWRLGKAKKSAQDDRLRIPREAMPPTLQIGTARAVIELRHDKPVVLLPLAQLPALARADASALPPASLRWKAELRDDTLLWGRPMQLSRLLALLPHLRLPDGPAAPPPRDLPIGALLDLERNLHTLTRLIPSLLAPFVVTRQRQGGWLGLVSNGEGGFWAELMTDWMDALTTTRTSLSDLRHELPPDDALSAELKAEIDTLEELDFRCKDALDAAKGKS